MNIKLVIVISLGFARMSFAATLASYSFAGYHPNLSSTCAPDYQAIGVNVSDFARSRTLQAQMDLGGFTATGWPANENILIPLNVDYYFGFTIAPEAGMVISLTSLQFDETGFNNGIRKFALRSSIDGFSQNIYTITRPLIQTTIPRTFTLDSTFSNLSGPVTFRLYGYEALSSGGGWSVSNFQIIGSAVPEPSAVVLSAISGLVLMTYRRRNIVAVKQSDK